MRRLLTVVSILSIVFLFFFGGVSRSLAAHEGKVYVCKYVGTPSVNETLQTGQNPIEVSINAIPDYQGVGSYFADAQGRSFVLATVPQDPEPTVADCPGGPQPSEEPSSEPTPSPSPSAVPSVDPSPSVTPSPQPSDAPSATPSATPSTSSSPSVTTVPPPTTGTTKTPPPTDTVGTTTKTDGLNLSLILAAVLAVSTLITLLQPRRLRRQVVRKNRS